MLRPSLLVIVLALPALALADPPAAERPLTSLPYTPSLDVGAMDRSANPCVDFYQYSCGGWMKKNPIPADQASWSVYGKLAQENQRFLWGLLEEAARPRPDRDATQQKIGDYFAACMDEPAVEKLGARPLKPDLDRIAALRSVKDLPALLARLQQATLGFYSEKMLFGFGSNQDFADSTQVIAFASAGGLGLPDRDYYVKTDPRSVGLRSKYVAHVTRMLQLLGEPADRAARDAQMILKLETELARVSLTRVDKRDPYKLFHRLGRKEVQALTPTFDWGAFLAANGLASVQVVNVTEPAFFKRLDALLRSVPLDDLKTYLRWQLVHAKAPYLSSPFVREDFDYFSRTLRGVKEMRPRWKRCVSHVDHQLGEALGQEFVRRTFTPDTKRRALDMVQRIERAMERDIKDLPWMSAATKLRALEKLHAIANKIGYPDRWRDYGALAIKRGDFFGNAERALIFESQRQLRKIGKPVDRGEWEMSPPTVNAYYEPQKNDMNFPAGVLQPPLFDVKLDDAPNYGNTGATIGHELTHGFDDEGRQFDSRGNLKDWWTKSDAAAFTERAQCIVDQYAQYTVVDDIKINSKLTLGEDVADLGGTILAYVAWREAVKGLKLKKRDGLTPDQRFFVGMAQWACDNQRPENLRVRAMTDPHSPDRYRVNGVVANMPEFQKAFRCKKGQPMVREKRCRVW